MSTQFIKLKQFKRGHSFWRAPDGRIVIADQSGGTPETTDDGPLYVDDKRSMVISVQDGKVIEATIPVRLSNGEQSRTPATVEELVYCNRVCDILTAVSESVFNLMAALEKLGVKPKEGE